jgi:cytochrome c oxidase subunit 2
MFRRQIIIAATTLFLAVAAMLAPLPLAAAAPRAYSLQVNARQYAFEPASLSVQRGDTITLHFESLDAAHGLFIDGYDVDLHAEPGKSADVTFIADRPGKFKIRCSVSCGALHPFMIGELEVEPNSPFLRATAAMLIAMAGAFVYFRHDPAAV